MPLKTVGITTTIPVEVIYAAGYKPVDLNNLFITSPEYMKHIELAESEGFPRSLCSWIKGIYGSVTYNKINKIVGVLEGDCSNTKVLDQILQSNSVKSIPFRYPTSHKFEDVKYEIDKFIELFNTTLTKVEEVRKKLNIIRNLVKKIDNLTVKGMVTGFENHVTLVNCSDFCGDPDGLKENLEEQITLFQKREPKNYKLKIGYIGVPPMTGDLYSYTEELDAGIIYNEVQREFSFPRESASIYHQYHDYTYAYSTEFRISEIKKQIKERKLDALIHYTQAFCHKGLEDILIKKAIEIPILTIEGDQSIILDARTKLRLETFIDMLKDLKEVKL